MIETRFKKTDIGEIPEDWEVSQIGKICDVGTGNRNTQDKVENGKYPFYVRSQQVERINSFSYDCEAVLTAGDGVGTGKVFHYINGKFEVHQRVYVMNNFVENVNGKFFYWYFSEKFYDRVHSMTAKSSVDSVRKKMVTEMNFSMPTLREQQRIATALSDIDALLSTLNKKIAKKKLIKQGAMQQLLTGKMRLAGFTEPWVEKKLGEIGSFIGGGTPNTKIEEYWNGTIPWISSSDISNGDIRNINITRYITEEAIKVSATNKCPIGSILLITRVGIGKLAVADQMICTSQDFTNICIGTDYNSIFIALLLSRLMMAKRDEGQGSTIKGITTEEIKSMIILLPLSIAEQTAIATILSDMDKEIEQLEAKRAKYEQVKQGMMQQLLTGKIRLID